MAGAEGIDTDAWREFLIRIKKMFACNLRLQQRKKPMRQESVSVIPQYRSHDIVNGWLIIRCGNDAEISGHEAFQVHLIGGVTWTALDYTLYIETTTHMASFSAVPRQAWVKLLEDVVGAPRP